MKTFISFLFIILAAPTALAHTNCQVLLAEHGWTVELKSWVAGGTLTSKDVEQILEGQNPFERRRDETALIFKSVIALLLQDISRDARPEK